MSYSYKAALIDSLTSDDKEVEHLSEWKLSELEEERKHRKIANGNLQARCRMMYLYDIASRYEGIVMSTDNQTEYQLGFWTLHGDVGDFNPLFGLWKHEVYELANWIADYYMNMSISSVPLSNKEKFLEMNQAIKKSICLTPTDGLGISNSDLDQIGAKSYNDVDDILQTAMDNKFSSVMGWMTPLIEKYGEDVVDNVWDRHVKSNYKRNNLPIIIERNKYGE